MKAKSLNTAMILALAAIVAAIVLRRAGISERAADIIRDTAFFVFTVALVAQDRLIGGARTWQRRWYVVLVVVAGLNFCATLFFR